MVTSRLERAVVAALSRCLPAGFRHRQRAEWTGDLHALADGGTGPRWRYLVGAALTLPALRTAARRGALSHVDGPAVAIAPPALTAVARILLYGLGLPVFAWLLSVPLCYYLFGVPDRMAGIGGGLVDPKDLWPDGWAYYALLPLIFVLTFGAWAVALSGPFLVGAMGLAGVASGLIRRRRRVAHRMSVIVGVGLLAIAVAGAFTGIGISTDPFLDRGHNLFVGVLGLIALALGSAARTLGGRMRVALLVIGVAAVAVSVTSHTPTGEAMFLWFID